MPKHARKKPRARRVLEEEESQTNEVQRPPLPPPVDGRKSDDSSSSSSSSVKAAPPSARATAATNPTFKHDEETVKLRLLMEVSELVGHAKAFLEVSGPPKSDASMNTLKLTVEAKRRALCAALATVAGTSAPSVKRGGTSMDTSGVKQYRPQAQSKLVELGLLPDACPVSCEPESYSQLKLLCGKNIWTLWEADVAREDGAIQKVYNEFRRYIRQKFVDEVALEPMPDGTPSPYLTSDAELRRDLYKSLSGGHIRKEAALQDCYLARISRIRHEIVHLCKAGVQFSRTQLAKLKGEYIFRAKHLKECYNVEHEMSDEYDMSFSGKDELQRIPATDPPHIEKRKAANTISV